MARDKLPIGSIGWIDLTVSDATELKDFYSRVAGWQSSEVSMENYADYNMISPSSGEPVAGICHARGVNKELPPYWLIYIVVGDLTESISQCKKLGGKIISGPKNMTGYGNYAVIQDPAGAYSALFEAID
jgi:predicted enzyme related to lactoylglutathione lyase